jgi:hypothetical protein
MRLFLYGTLRDPDLLAALAGCAIPFTPARLRGWRRVALLDSGYPTLRRARGVVEGGGRSGERKSPHTGAARSLRGPVVSPDAIVVQTAHGSTAARKARSLP